jgi:hypothetical protein
MRLAFFVGGHELGLEFHCAAPRHCITRIDRKIKKRRLDLHCIRCHRREEWRELATNSPARAEARP